MLGQLDMNEQWGDYSEILFLDIIIVMK